MNWRGMLIPEIREMVIASGITVMEADQYCKLTGVELNGCFGGYDWARDIIVIVPGKIQGVFQINNTVLHELMHAMGAKQRLNRPYANARLITPFEINREEQTAQFAASLIHRQLNWCVEQSEMHTEEYLFFFTSGTNDYVEFGLKSIDYINKLVQDYRVANKVA